MDEDVVGRVVSALEDDAFRRGGSITHDRLLTLAAKHKLPADAIVTVKQRLLSRDVHIEGAEDDESGETPAESVTAEPADEPAPEALAEVRDILTAFYQDAAKVKHLSAAEEVALSRRIHAGFDAKARLLEIEDPGIARELESLVRDGEAARKHLTEANLLLVPFVAKRVHHRGALTDEDLIQEGNLGLLRAVDRFDGAVGTRFSTYACWWIWSFMKRAVDDRSRLVRLPVHILDRVPTLLRMQKALAREKDGGPVTPQELADHLGWRIQTVMFVLQALEAGPVSLDASPDDESHSLGEQLASPPESRPDTAAVQSEERGKINGLVTSLGEKLAFIVRERFGLVSGIPRTLEDIGAQMGVTRERIRQLEAKALKKLRHPSRTKVFADLLGLEPRDLRTPEGSDSTEVVADNDNDVQQQEETPDGTE